MGSTLLSAPKSSLKRGKRGADSISRKQGPGSARLQAAFERAVRRYLPDVKIEWQEKTRSAG